jgi:hypothetical protein
VSAKSKRFLLTACFDRVMNEAWYDKLDKINRNAMETSMLTLGLLSFGVLAPFFIDNRNQNQDEQQEQSTLNIDAPQELSTWNRDEPQEQSPLNREEPQEQSTSNRDDQ